MDGRQAAGGVPAGARQWIEESETLTTSAGHRIAYRRRGQGPAVLMLHGFPTWSYDYAEVAADLEADHHVVTLDFLGYGVSDKPDPYDYTVTESADIVEELVAHLSLGGVDLVVHDYGAIVGQELLDRRRHDALGFTVRSVTVLNCAIVYSAYRPTTLQKLLVKPVLGHFVASRVTPSRARAGLDAVRGTAKLTDAEFESLWLGMSRDNGHKLTYRLIRYNTERDLHHARWEAALREWDGPLHLMWGLADPVSGAHVLERARRLLPQARVTALADAGHFPQSESPRTVAAAIRGG
ncbi:Pimeloyl-ACP methyl ester carboxylesterase [Actinacidiphila alni]|uniref:Pimeloyl-ACP methyl ester carboxylesterase n=1 Tax=Actinacidiphila alni TaxID=380248 RepID=A0A1I2MVN7_9ACTN|nr:alpha/beta hydrolase [Actinacidiphila alni]SFF94719.1 Pimeloyl-ACP methyl ester carboxylesterase [Actinacidiphila alni]